MIVHRFMSDKEYNSLVAGDTLTNTTNHDAKGQRSTSIGFCFFTEEPDKAIHWLSTIVSTDWCVTFDIPDQMLTKSRARYRDPERDNWPLAEPATIWRTEWCLQEYSLDNVKVIGATEQWKYYVEKLKRQVVDELGPFGELLIKMSGL